MTRPTDQTQVTYRLNRGPGANGSLYRGDAITDDTMIEVNPMTPTDPDHPYCGHGLPDDDCDPANPGHEVLPGDLVIVAYPEGDADRGTVLEISETAATVRIGDRDRRVLVESIGFLERPDPDPTEERYVHILVAVRDTVHGPFSGPQRDVVAATVRRVAAAHAARVTDILSSHSDPDATALHRAAGVVVWRAVVRLHGLRSELDAIEAETAQTAVWSVGQDDPTDPGILVATEPFYPEGVGPCQATTMGDGSGPMACQLPEDHDGRHRFVPVATDPGDDPMADPREAYEFEAAADPDLDPADRGPDLGDLETGIEGVYPPAVGDRLDTAPPDGSWGPCGSGWTGQRCQLPLDHEGPHDDELTPDGRTADEVMVDVHETGAHDLLPRPMVGCPSCELNPDPDVSEVPGGWWPRSVSRAVAERLDWIAAGGPTTADLQASATAARELDASVLADRLEPFLDAETARAVATDPRADQVTRDAAATVLDRILGDRSEPDPERLRARALERFARGTFVRGSGQPG